MILWFFILVLQSSFFTLVSRARNSGDITYHAIASVFTNSIWFVSQLFLISMIAKPGMPIITLVKMGICYTIGTTVGSVLMHWIALKYLEKGKRKVGA